jgi:hypothetical protein
MRFLILHHFNPLPRPSKSVFPSAGVSFWPRSAPFKVRAASPPKDYSAFWSQKRLTSRPVTPRPQTQLNKGVNPPPSLPSVPIQETFPAWLSGFP